MKALRKYDAQPDYAVAPGETLREVVESLGMTQKELALRTDLTEQSLVRIFKGNQPITYETANRLELVTGVPARFWNNLEAQYREQLAKIEERERLESDLQWLNTIPVTELVKRGAIAACKDKALLLRETLSFYGVSSVHAWKTVWERSEVAARRSSCFESRPGAASAWIRLGERKAQEIECASFNKAVFQQALEEIRQLTSEESEVFEPAIRRLCTESGVALVLVPKMLEVPWNGATKWLSPHKAMILLNLRGKGEDRFWFSLFHEAGHVLHDNKKGLYIADESDDPVEARANEFAANFLIPERYNEQIRRLRSKVQVRELAQQLGISPGIVAGRYQFLTEKWQFFKDQIRCFNWQ